jgi:hypothetical protein
MIFKRFQKSWELIDRSNYETVTTIPTTDDYRELGGVPSGAYHSEHQLDCKERLEWPGIFTVFRFGGSRDSSS